MHRFDRSGHTEVPNLVSNVILTIRIQILRLMLVILKQRDRPDKCLTVAEHIHLRESVVIECQTVVYLQPSGNALIVAGCEEHLVLGCGVSDGLAGLSVPDGGVSSKYRIM